MTPKDQAALFIGQNLKDYLLVLHNMALGQIPPQVTERTYKPKGLLTTKQGEQRLPGSPTELVLVEERHISLPPDRTAAEYLIDRVLGKPKAENTTPAPTKEIPTSFSPTVGLYELPPSDLDGPEQ